MSSSLDSYYSDNTAITACKNFDGCMGNAYSSSYDEFRSKASKVWDAAAQQSTFADSSDLDDWEITNCSSGFDNSNTDAMKKKAEGVRNFILGGGAVVATAAQNIRVGGFVLKHGLGIWSYASTQASVAQASTWSGHVLSWLPTTVQQYACANAATATVGALAETIITVPLIGAVSAASLATTGTALMLGITVIKTVGAVYNATMQHEDQKVSLPLKEVAKEVAGKIGF